LGETLVQFDNSSKSAEMNEYSFFKFPNSDLTDMKKSEIKINISKYSKIDFTLENIFLIENILGYSYYLAFIENSLGQKKYYVFSEQSNKAMEYEIEGLFNNNNFTNEIIGFEKCCCLNENNKWQYYAIKKENSKCPEMKICTISIKQLCEK